MGFEYQEQYGNNYILKNCKIYDDKIDKFFIKNIEIKDGKISKIEDSLDINTNTKKNLPIIDLNEKLVIGGVIDAHVHFRYGNDEKETLKTGCEAGLNGGVCFAIDMPNSNPPTITKQLFDEKVQKAKDDKCTINLYFSYGVTENNYNDVVDDAKFYKIFMVKSVGELFIKDYYKLKEILMQNKLFAIHAEHKNFVEEFNQTMDKFKFKTHCKMRDRYSEINAIGEVLDVLSEIDKEEDVVNNRITPRVHFCHVSTSEALTLIKKAKEALKNVVVTCEVAPHHLILNEEMAEDLKGLGKFNPPLRTKMDNLALIEGIVDKTVDLIATDHAPHTYEQKMKDNILECPSGIGGIETLVPIVFNLAKEKKIKLEDAIKMVSINPSKIFDINNSLNVSNMANITIIDLCDNTTIKASEFKSKAKFSPYDNMTFKCKVYGTIINGKYYKNY
ncbi:dihydroorotase [Methanococcus voltae]|uniref:Dihydroorotase n=1 Tax=Methanococcus voltae TaxID=2188 RepID=A0A8J7US30_METVO|nr:dihydroorotase [Methanococcus voltae]MBP2201192.1 dihydroorotase [Methanococcus voltae]